MTPIFVVFATRGEYSDRYVRAAIAFRSKEAAEKCATDCTKNAIEIEKEIRVRFGKRLRAAQDAEIKVWNSFPHPFDPRNPQYKAAANSVLAMQKEIEIAIGNYPMKSLDPGWRLDLDDFTSWEYYTAEVLLED